ncbi:amino acid permease, partial [Lactiplantibacillus pentosus]
MATKDNEKITLIALVMMIFTTVFGFANSTVAYYLMGYSSILFYLVAAVLFFIPFALMMAEFGAAVKSDSSGMYKWLEVSVNAKFAFVGTFMWFASYIIWLVSTSAKVWIPFTTIFFGSDQTQRFAMFGLNATQMIGILSCLWMVLVTFISIKGMKGIVRVTSLGGLAVTSLT